jgi:thioredoxin-related protein
MIKALMALSLIVSYTFAEINWSSSYDAAIISAKQENKNVLVMLSKEGCPPCEYMKNTVFEESAISDMMNKYFIPVHIDVRRDKIPEGLRYIGTPTFYFISPSGNKLKRIDGGANIPKFMEILNSVKK